jgi:hypothetical protein
MAKEIEPPVVEVSPLPTEEKTTTTHTVKTLHLDDAQYALLTRALRESIAPELKDLQADAPGPNVPAVVTEASQPLPANLRIVSPDRPLGTPIV